MVALALEDRDESEGARWGLSFAAILALHVGFGAWLLPRVAVLDPGAPPPAVIIDLAPAQVATAEQPDAAPPTVEPEIPPPPEPPQAAIPAEEPPQPATPELLLPAEPVPKVEPEVALPKPEPPKVQPKPKPELVRPKPRPPEPKVAKPEPKPRPTPDRARSAEGGRPGATSRPGPQRTASIAGGAISGPSPNLSGWHASVRARLQSLQRYPAEAQARGESGTAIVAFVIDRSGRVVSARLAGSSGSPVLDQASVGMVRTASLPPPPPDVPGSSFPFTIPLRYRPR